MDTVQNKEHIYIDFRPTTKPSNEHPSLANKTWQESQEGRIHFVDQHDFLSKELLTVDTSGGKKKGRTNFQLRLPF